jgi:hypothetical protein
MDQKLKQMADEMTEEEIIKKIDEYQKFCDRDEKNMETDDSMYWINDLEMRLVTQKNR